MIPFKTSFAAALVAGFIALAWACSSTPASVLSADNIAIDLTDTVCAPLENQISGQPYVDFICALAEGTEDVISVLETPTADAGTEAGLAGAAAGAPNFTGTAIVKNIKSVRIRIPTADAPAFMAAHRKGK